MKTLCLLLIALTASLPTSAQYSPILSKTNIFLKMNQLWKQQHIKTKHKLQIINFTRIKQIRMWIMNIKLPKSKFKVWFKVHWVYLYTNQINLKTLCLLWIALTASLPTSAQYSTILSKTNIFLKMNQLWKQQHIKTTTFAKREFG